MAQFGQLIDSEIPVLIAFYEEDNKYKSSHSLHVELREVSAQLGGFAKIIKIDMAKNHELVFALRIRHNPTYLIYNNGEMIIRKDEHMFATELIEHLKILVS